MARHQEAVVEQATQLGEEVSVLRMMDRHLGAIAEDAERCAAALASDLGDPEHVKVHVAGIRSALEMLYEAARDRF